MKNDNTKTDRELMEAFLAQLSLDQKEQFKVIIERPYLFQIIFKELRKENAPEKMTAQASEDFAAAREQL